MVISKNECSPLHRLTYEPWALSDIMYALWWTYCWDSTDRWPLILDGCRALRWRAPCFVLSFDDEAGMRCLSTFLLILLCRECVLFRERMEPFESWSEIQAINNADHNTGYCHGKHDIETWPQRCLHKAWRMNYTWEFRFRCWGDYLAFTSIWWVSRHRGSVTATYACAEIRSNFSKFWIKVHTRGT